MLGSVGIIVLCIVVAGLLLFFFRRAWPPRLRREHNDLIGWQLSILGTTYAVIIGFMLYAVWTNFRSAELNAQMEANCLVQVVRLSSGLPAAQQARIQQLARDYAKAMIDQEWPAMRHNRLSPAGTQIARQLWTTIVQAEVQAAPERIAVDQSLAQLSSMLEHRRIRQLQSQSTLPGILWAVLIIGGIITVASSFLFGTENFKLHAAQTLALTLMISLVLVAIADLNRPFRGGVHVSSSGFSFAIDRINILSSTPP